MQRAQGDLGGALKSYQTGMDIRRKLVERDPGNADWQRDLSISHNKIGEVQRAQGDLGGALKNYQADMEIARKLAKRDPRQCRGAARSLGQPRSDRHCSERAG